MTTTHKPEPNYRATLADRLGYNVRASIYDDADGLHLATTAEHEGYVVACAWNSWTAKAVPVAFTIARHDGGPVTPSALRALPLPQIVDASRQALAFEVAAGPGSPSLVERALELDAPPLIPNLHRAGTPMQGRRLTKGDLQKVAVVYRRAASEGRPAVRAVMDAFGIGKSAAVARIAKAREEGVLK